MYATIPQTYAFGPQVVLSSLSTSTSTLIHFTRPLNDRTGVWFNAPASNTAIVSVALIDGDAADFDRNAVLDLTPGEKRLFFVKEGQPLYAFSKSPGQELVSYEVVVERLRS